MDFMNNSRFPSGNKFHTVIYLSIIIIIFPLFVLYFVLQDSSQNNIRDSLFEDQMQIQFDTNKALSQHISSNIELLLSRLEIISNSLQLRMQDQGQLGEQITFSGNITQELLENMYNQSRNLIGESGIIYVADKTGQIRSIYSNQIIIANVESLSENDTKSSAHKEFQNISDQNYFIQSKESKRPVLSDGPSSIYDNLNNNTYSLIFSVPIIHEKSKDFMGVVAISFSAAEFFKRLGNIYDIESSYLTVLDGNATQIVHSNIELIGRNFFDEYTQLFIGQNSDLNSLITNVSRGDSGFVVYSLEKLGERLTTGFPIFISNNGQNPQYMVFIVTPTSQIYEQINNLLYIQKIEILILLTITTSSIIILILFLIRWNRRLELEVEKRTGDLVQSNIHLKNMTDELQNTNESLVLSSAKIREINEELKLKDKLQKEFINIAAHELRTPVQALVGYSELLKEDKKNFEKYILAILRNSERLEKLTNNILDTSRIENNIFYLKKEIFNFSLLLQKVVNEFIEYEYDVNNDQNKGQASYSEMKNEGHSNLGEGDDIIFSNDGNEYRVRNTQIQWITHIESDIYIYADKERIVQVISNLISNSLNFTKKGFIEIILKKSYEEAIFEIMDTGKGIDSDILPKLFSKFATKSISGTGLGLFISKNIIEAHGGKIWAKNNYADNKDEVSNKATNINKQTFSLTGATIGFSLPLKGEEN